MITYHLGVSSCWSQRGEGKEKGKDKTLSSSSSAKMVEVPAMHNTQQVLKPETVDDYNHCMNGVDRSDQFSVSYPFVRKTPKWWRKLFFYLLEVSTVNSFILYREVTQKKKKTAHLDFRQSLVESLVTEYLQQQESRRSSIGRPLS